MGKDQVTQDEKIKQIQNFWNDQAKDFGAIVRATTNDPLIKNLELSALARVLSSDEDIVEAGCGNGNNLIKLSGNMNGRLFGFDYSSEMVKYGLQAVEENKVSSQVELQVGDVLDDLSDIPVVPQIFTDRCLINLPTHDLQIDAVRNLKSRLKKGGKMALLECARQPLERLNELRACVDLPAISQHWHNNYLDEERFLSDIPYDLELIQIDSFSSTYYLASRVFNAVLTAPGETPDYLADINRAACKLPPFGDVGPHKLYLFQRV